MIKKKIWANFQRILELFTKKIVKKLFKYGLGIRDPRSGIRVRKKPIPDPGSRVKKAPDPGSGSATLDSPVEVPLILPANGHQY
jgi:hypothetical protein